MTITPYIGVDKVKFGASQAELCKAVGRPQSKSKGWNGGTNWEYSEYVVRFPPKIDRVVEVEIFPPQEVEVCGVNAFADPLAFEKLLDIDGMPYELYGIIVLLELGLSLSDLRDTGDANRSVCAFEQGRWDDMKDKMKPYRIAKRSSKR